jgi:hypothetical protein
VPSSSPLLEALLTLDEPSPDRKLLDGPVDRLSGNDYVAVGEFEQDRPGLTTATHFSGLPLPETHAGLSRLFGDRLVWEKTLIQTLPPRLM